jgi:hypothetical protein
VLLLVISVAVLAGRQMAFEKRRIAIAAGLPPPVFKFPSWRWLIPAALVGTCFYVCTPRQYDVTKRFPNEVGMKWCTTTDLFLVRFPDTGKLYVESAGSTSDVPNSFTDWQLHPNDWQKLPAYAAEFDRSGAHPGDIRAGIPRGTSFRIVKVIKDVNPEAGTFINPQVIFDGTASRLGAADAGLIRSHDVDASDHLTFASAKPCR